MGKAAREHLCHILNEHLNNVHETFQVLDQTPASSVDKITWNQIIQMGEQISKQATLVGMLWTGETPETKDLEENMRVFFNLLQGFLLLSHGSTVGAGPTLSSSINASVKKVVDCSFMLLKESVSSFGSQNKEPKLSITQLVGTVWDACSALKKTPSTNITAIGRVITQVAVSIKDVLREMKELKPADEEASDVAEAESQVHDSDNSCSGDLGNDLSPEEMKIAQLATIVVSETLSVIKEVIRSITGLMNREKAEQDGEFVSCLERVLKVCQGIGAEIDEVGACLYPPQEVSAIKVALQKICSNIDEIRTELDNLKGSSEGFGKVCIGLRSSVAVLESELGCFTVAADIVPKMENLAVSS